LSPRGEVRGASAVAIRGYRGLRRGTTSVEKSATKLWAKARIYHHHDLNFFFQIAPKII
jgi:hypothetical protein